MQSLSWVKKDSASRGAPQPSTKFYVVRMLRHMLWMFDLALIKSSCCLRISPYSIPDISYLSGNRACNQRNSKLMFPRSSAFQNLELHWEQVFCLWRSKIHCKFRSLKRDPRMSLQYLFVKMHALEHKKQESQDHFAITSSGNVVNNMVSCYKPRPPPPLPPPPRPPPRGEKPENAFL